MTITHTPAHSTCHPDRFENEETGWGYSVLQDVDAEDPRSRIEPEHAALWAYRQPRLSSSVAADRPDNPVIDAFAEFYDYHDADTALELTRRWLRIFHPENKLQIQIGQVTGYSQGDWLDMIAVVAEGYGTPDSHLQQFGQWAFGDVWTVIPDRGAGISGIYADDSEEALAYFRENFEDDEPEPEQTRAHVWANALPEAIAECLADREEPAAEHAATWLKVHEDDGAVWSAINRLFDELQQLAADNQE